ncbi:hypothetical protein [Streptomyces sp. YGL11-2]|uniref:hypothetical protein n=1 Tax=Streptomyces sp. YGL11-2 TaxID=3414028 RepID=UPI003CF6BDE4
MSHGTYGPPFGAPLPPGTAEVFTSQRLAGQQPYETVVAPWLQPHERLHAVVAVKLCGAIVKRVPRRHRPAKPNQEGLGGRTLAALMLPLTAVFTIAQTAAEALATALSAAPRGLVALLRGSPFKGGWHSQAGQVVVTVRTGPARLTTYDNDSALLTFTDRRILLVHSGVRGAELLGELAREWLCHAEIRHWTFSHRVDLTFSDGSLIAVEARKPEAEALRHVTGGQLRNGA